MVWVAKILTIPETITECVNAEKYFLEKLVKQLQVESGRRNAWKKRVRFKLN